jgi:hypothetical protein
MTPRWSKEDSNSRSHLEAIGKSGPCIDVAHDLRDPCPWQRRVPTLNVPADPGGSHPAGTAHSVAADADTNHVFVPIAANNAVLNCLTGCITIYGRDASGAWPHDLRAAPGQCSGEQRRSNRCSSAGCSLRWDRGFESRFLQRGVRCEPVSRGNSPSYVEKRTRLT